MKRMKKVLSVLLSVVFVFSCMSVGMVGFAASSDATYKSLAESFFAKSGANIAQETITAGNASFTMPMRSIVGDLTRYTSTNTSDDYKYADADGKPVRSLGFEHKIVAGDDESYVGGGAISEAFNYFYAIVNSTINAEKKKDPKSVPTPDKMIDTIVSKLKTMTNSDGSLMFFDGYMYFVDATGNVVSRTQDKVYSARVNKGDVDITYNTYDGKGHLVGSSTNAADQHISADLGMGSITTSNVAAQRVQNGQISLKTIWDLCNVKTVMENFFGGSASVNAGNWFHKFVFEIKTDVNYILENDTNVTSISVQDKTVQWKMGRTYDDSGTEASYYTDSVSISSAPVTLDTTGDRLGDLQTEMTQLFSTFYGETPKDGNNNPISGISGQFINGLFNDDYNRYSSHINGLKTIWNNSQFLADYDLFRSVSNKVLINFFKEDAFSYMNLLTNLRPSDGDPNLPVRYSDKYNTEYRITNATCSGVVDTIDEIFTNKSIVKIITPLIPMLTAKIDPNSTIGGLLGGLVIDETSGTNIHDIINNVVPQVLFQDSIVNLIISKLYPLVTNLLDKQLTNDFINGILSTAVSGVDLSGLAGWAVNSDKGGWQALVYAILAKIHVGLYPSAFAYCMDFYGFADQYPRIYQAFVNGKGGSRDNAGDVTANMLKSGTNHWSDYSANLIGVEGDAYCGNRWGGVNFDMLDGAWGINGDRDKFMKAITCALTPVAPLLASLLGNQSIILYVTTFLGCDVSICLNYPDTAQNTIDVYAKVLLPLLEALGLGVLTEANGFAKKDCLKSANEFRTLASGIIGESNAYANIERFLQDGLLNPLLAWIFDVVLKNPIAAIADLLPNVVLYLESGALYHSITDLSIPLVLLLPKPWFTLGITDVHPVVYTLNVGSLLGDKLDMLKSLDGILKLINISAKTENPVIGYVKPNDSASDPFVKSPDGPAWEQDKDQYTEAVYEAWADAMYVTDGKLNANAVTVSPEGKITRNILLYQNDDGTRVKIKGLTDYGDLIYENLVTGGQIGFSDGTNIITHIENDTQAAQYTTPVYRCLKYTATVGAASTTMYTYLSNKSSLTPEQQASSDVYQEISYYSVPVALPPIMPYKLMGCGVITDLPSLRDDDNTSTRYGMIDSIGTNPYNWDGTNYTWNATSGTILNGWAPKLRLGVRLDDSGRGKVLIFLLRYILSALNYRPFDSGSNTFTGVPFIQSFVKKSQLENPIIGDLTMGTLIDNIALDPDGVICLLFELLTPKFPNETSDLSMYDIEETLRTGVLTPGHMESGKTDYYKYSMSNVDYEYTALSKAARDYNDKTYGTETMYTEYWTREDSRYLTDNLDEVIGNIGAMLGPKGDDPGIGIDLSKGISGILTDLIDGYITNDIVSTIAGALYPLLDGLLNGALKGILDGALSANYSKEIVAEALQYTFGTNDVPAAQKLIADVDNGDEIYTKQTFCYLDGTPLAWGLGDSAADKALRGNMNKFDVLLKDLSALFSPFAIIFRFLMTGEDLTVLRELDSNGNPIASTGLLRIPGYEGYHYAWIPLMRALGAETGLLNYRDYFQKCYLPTNLNGCSAQVAGNVNTVEYLLKPIIEFAKNLLANPIPVLFGIIPNFIFYLTIGAFSDTINNLIQPVYVLLDMVKPVVDAIPLVNSLIANLDIKGAKLPLSLPLDLDFNSLVNSLVGGLLGDLLSFDIRPKKNVIGKTLVPVTQNFEAKAATLDALSGQPAVIAQDVYDNLMLFDKEEGLNYQPLYRILRDAGGRAQVDMDETSETYGQIMYEPVLDTDPNSATFGQQVYGRYSENGVLYQNAGADYTDCFVKIEAKDTPVYEVAGYDSDGMPTYKTEFERKANSPMKDKNGNVYLQDADFDPKTRTCWTALNEYDTTRPIANTKKPLEKEGDYYAWGSLSISLPYLDLNTLCYGTLDFQPSNRFNIPYYVGIDSAGGADLITVIVRLVVKVLTLKQNTTNIVQWLDSTCLLDADEEDLLKQVLSWVMSLFSEFYLIDRVLQIVMVAYKLIVPVSGKLAEKFADPNCEYNIQSLFAAIKKGVTEKDLSIATNAISNIISSGPQKDPDYDSGAGEKLSIFAKIIQALKKFFENIKLFFQKLVGKA